MINSALEFQIEHIGLPSRDTVRLKDWYVQALRGRVVFDNKASPPAFFVALGGATMIEIYPANSSGAQTGDNNLAGWRHLALRVESIEAARTELESRGVHFEQRIKPAGGGGRVLFFQDIEGNLLHLVERTPQSFSKRFDAIIFDMDGVIVNSEPVHERAFRDVFAEIGFAENHGIDFPAYYGRTDRVLWQDFFAKHQPPHTLEELTARKQDRYLRIIKEEQPIFESLPELIARLSPIYKLAVASGSLHPVIDEILAMKELRRFFPIVVSVQDVKRGKPAPDIFLRTAELLALPPNRCCVIEDSIAGVDAARAAGMEVIAITNSFPAAALEHATYVVSDYAEIERILL